MSAGRAAVQESGILEIIAFHLHDQEFCVRTTAIREIRGWDGVTPIPHAPPEVMGVVNLRGKVIPIVDLSRKLGMKGTEPGQRSAIVVAEVYGMATGLVVDRVSDILTISSLILQPVPETGLPISKRHVDGIVVQPNGLICFLSLEAIFAELKTANTAAA